MIKRWLNLWDVAGFVKNGRVIAKNADVGFVIFFDAAIVSSWVGRKEHVLEKVAEAVFRMLSRSKISGELLVVAIESVALDVVSQFHDDGILGF